MRMSFEEEGTEAMLLVDATGTNAFNNLNRSLALYNIKQICPSFHCFLKNCYQSPVKLYVNNNKDGANSKTHTILSQEGATQGDPSAMPMYSLSTRPLIDDLSETLERTTRQVWYADDSTSCGKLESLKRWWDR